MPSIEFTTHERVCFWGAPASVSKSNILMSDCMIATGQNTGNLFIGSGMFNALNAPVKAYWDFYTGSPEEYDDRFDLLAIPASNFIHEFTDLSDQYNFFRQTKTKILMFGLGSQLSDLSSSNIPAGTLDFLRLVSERSTSIGVRGEITADISRRLGIANVRVTGCPSMMSVPNTFDTIQFDRLDDLSVAGNFSHNARHHAFSEKGMTSVEGSLMRELLRRDGDYIIQNEPHELSLMDTLPFHSAFTDQDHWHLNRFKKLFGFAESSEGIKEFLRWNTHVFFDVENWKNFLRRKDFSFGTRFHGNVAAILAGKPVFMLCHDYRTLELCRVYKIPHMVVDSFTTPPTIEELALKADMQPFHENYAALAAVWIAFAKENGLDATYTS